MTTHVDAGKARSNTELFVVSIAMVYCGKCVCVVCCVSVSMCVRVRAREKANCVLCVQTPPTHRSVGEQAANAKETI